MGLLFSNLEYVTLRLIRRWVVPDVVLAVLSRLLPERYMAPNVGISGPERIVVRWEEAARSQGRSFGSLKILEVGAGGANATGQAMLVRGAESWIGMDPYFAPVVTEPRLLRVRDVSDLPSASVDAVVSHSVLEHVEDPEALFAACRRVLKPGGFMIHIVDYRDHFFKYPFHFLQFSRTTWRWLNPGDLPRWRLTDHLRNLKRAGFTTVVVQTARDDKGFARVLPHVSKDFDVDDPDIAVTEAVLFSTAG
jgi:SAM-dependent methyltransferase